MEYIRRHLTVASIVIDNFTNGYIRSVFHTHRQLYRRYVSVGISHYHRRDKSVCIFEAGKFFFARNFCL